MNKFRLNERVICLIIGSAALVIATGIGLGGCSTADNSGPAGHDRGVELSFDLSKCQPIDQNMYRCPAIDKPICNPAYAPAGVECLKIGKKGGVYVTANEME